MAYPVSWTPTAFEYWLDSVHSPDKRQRALEDLTSPQRKMRREWLTFKRFVEVAKLDIDPRTVENRTPPEPDIYCEESGLARYFELGEVTDESIPHNEAMAQRANRDVHGGCISPTDPFARMILGKCGKVYGTAGTKVDLLLHFSVGHHVPCSQLLRIWISESRERVNNALFASPFDRIWIFDCWTDQILETLQR